jgi:hypothetical protein
MGRETWLLVPSEDLILRCNPTFFFSANFLLMALHYFCEVSHEICVCRNKCFLLEKRYPVTVNGARIADRDWSVALDDRKPGVAAPRSQRADVDQMKVSQVTVALQLRGEHTLRRE